MPLILVVDDSPTDRRVLGGLLEKNEGWTVAYAESGSDALARVKDSPPDAVITDLMMPEMDGMELVSNIRITCPDVPVILTTSYGSQLLAVRALEEGAASYVPKNEVADKLVETVKQVLEVAETDKSYKRLIECLDETQYRFRLENDPALIPPLVNLIQQMAFAMTVCDATGRRQLGVAMDEALLNAMYHGNLELPVESLQAARSQLRDGETVGFIEERRLRPPYRDRRVFVEIRITPEEAQVVVRDEGSGLSSDAMSQAEAPEAIEREGGRGLVLIRKFMDEVRLNETGNELAMVLRKSSDVS